MIRLTLAGFRYSPAIGGAENYARRLLAEIGDRAEVEVLTVLTDQRTDWLRSLIDGVRDDPRRYEVDGRGVTALAQWPARTRRALRPLVPAYHVPGSPAPWRMGKLLAPHLEPLLKPGGVLHNVFMGREAFSAGLMVAGRRVGMPFVFTPLRHQRPLGWSSPAFRRLYQESDALIALTHGEGDWLVEHGARRSRVHVIGLGPQNDPAAPTGPALSTVGEGLKIVLFLGQLHEYKGFEALLGAARLMEADRDVVFVFAGPDVRGNGAVFNRAPANARWLGSVPSDLRDSLLAACSVLCVPSSRESFGSVVVEAWACAKPVVGGPAGATRELIADGVDGFTVPQDPKLIADRLRRLLGDPVLATEMGCRGREKVERQFTWSAIAQRHLDLYEKVLS